MSGVKYVWVNRNGVLQLRLRGKHSMKLAYIRTTSRGYMVLLHDGEVAGPYGDLNVARQSAARRLERLERSMQ